MSSKPVSAPGSGAGLAGGPGLGLALVGSLIAVALAAAPCRAAEDGVYLEVTGGSTRLPDQDATLEAGGGRLRGDVDFDTGYQVGVGLGYRRGPFRFEAHGGYGASNIPSVTFESIVIETQGDLDVYTAFANVLYDVRLKIPVHPFIGFGLGVARLDLAAHRRPEIFKSRGADTVFAWNATTGVSVPLAEHLDLLFRYRFVGAEEATFDATLLGIPGDLEVEYNAHEFDLGFRVNF